jgi:hypothetical protein
VDIEQEETKLERATTVVWKRLVISNLPGMRHVHMRFVDWKLRREWWMNSLLFKSSLRLCSMEIFSKTIIECDLFYKCRCFLGWGDSVARLFWARE